jgi:hypothetical protein
MLGVFQAPNKAELTIKSESDFFMELYIRIQDEPFCGLGHHFFQARLGTQIKTGNEQAKNHNESHLNDRKKLNTKLYLKNNRYESIIERIRS